MNETPNRKIDRLYWIIKDRKLTIKDIEDSCGISNGNLYKVKSNDKTDLTWNMLSRILENIKYINSDWLIKGIGEPYNKEDVNSVSQNNHDKSQNTQNVYTGINQNVIDLLNSTIATLNKQLEDKQRTIDSLNETIKSLTDIILHCKSTANQN